FLVGLSVCAPLKSQWAVDRTRWTWPPGCVRVSRPREAIGGTGEARVDGASGHVDVRVATDGFSLRPARQGLVVPSSETQDGFTHDRRGRGNVSPLLARQMVQ